jgi:hypothetical protein
LKERKEWSKSIVWKWRKELKLKDLNKRSLEWNMNRDWSSKESREEKELKSTGLNKKKEKLKDRLELRLKD